MYSDQSKNFMTALQGVDMIIGGMHSGMDSAMSPAVDYGDYQRGLGLVRVGDYNAVVMAHNELVREVNRLALLVQLREAEIRILRRHAVRQ